MNAGNIDIVTSCFESAGAALSWINVRALFRDRNVKGVWWPGTLLFLAWGFWGLFYYPLLGLRFSHGALAVRLAGQVVWVGMVIYFKRKE